jgi:hypothetical protein
MTDNVMDKRKKVYSETVNGMTDNVMAKRKSVIRNST